MDLRWDNRSTAWGEWSLWRYTPLSERKPHEPFRRHVGFIDRKQVAGVRRFCVRLEYTAPHVAAFDKLSEAKAWLWATVVLGDHS